MTKQELELALKYHIDCKDLLIAHKGELPISSMQNTLQKYTKFADEQIAIITEELKGFGFNMFMFLVFIAIALYIWSAFNFNSNVVLLEVIAFMGFYFKPR